MSIVYLIFLAGVASMVVAVTAQAVLAVSRKPVWQTQRHALQLVETVDRRQQALPFVGQERRNSAELENAPEISARKAA